MVFKGERFKSECILVIKTHYKPTNTFQYKHFNSCHPAGAKNGFNVEAMRLLRTKSSSSSCEIQTTPQNTRISKNNHTRVSLRVNFASSPSALTQKKEADDRIFPFVTTYHPAVSNLRTDFDGSMKPHRKSPFSENYLFETSDNIIQKT